ncbi:MAG TPA: MBL fold metallo-hydrolase [Chloroflexota bacterium]|nr:MBL fold metallo-hydrolase [Chloroflexota bacterium]
MDITYAGDASFLLRGEGTVAINPTAKSDAAIRLFSSRQRGKKLIINGPGEYEIGDVLITTVPAGNGKLAHAVDLDGIRVLHLPDAGTSFDDQTLRDIGRVDILILHADDVAAVGRAINDLVPRTVVPYGAYASQVCVLTGVKDAESLTRFTWNGMTSPPKAVLLRVPGSRRRAA